MAMSDPQCGAIPPNVGGPIPCHLDPGHDGQHFSTSGCPGSVIGWTTPTPAADESGAGA